MGRIRQRMAIALVGACILIAVLSVFTAVAQAQTGAVNWVYGWVGNKAAWLRIGPTLQVTGDVLDTKPSLAPPTPLVHRKVGIRLAAAELGGWTIPSNALDIEIYVNGIHYWEGVDYKIEAGRVVPLSTINMPLDADVRASYNFVAAWIRFGPFPAEFA